MFNKKITIIDYDCGNIWSVKNAFKFLGIKTNIIKTCSEILESDCLILPGDGSFKIINNLKKKGIDKSLNFVANEKKIPILGICLGMQLFGTTSEESRNDEGFDWIKGSLKKYRPTTSAVVINISSIKTTLAMYAIKVTTLSVARTKRLSLKGMDYFFR